MSWRIVAVSSNAKLDYKMDYLVVRTANDTKRVHLSEISVLMIESTAVSLTAYLLCELAKRKIDIIFCDEKRCPFGSFIPYYGSHDTSRKLRMQTQWRKDTKEFVWAEIVRAKISGQTAVLEHNEKGGCELLRSYLSEIAPGDETNREGHAAKVYFNSLFGMEFSRSDDCITNAALNYGYGILLSLFARETVANGYCTQLGIFHDNVFNQYNLACDLMEPFRPFVDDIAVNSHFEVFEHEEKMTFVQMLNRTVIIDGKSHYLVNAAKVYAKSVFDAINENDISQIKFPKYELQIYENDSVL